MIKNILTDLVMILLVAIPLIPYICLLNLHDLSKLDGIVEELKKIHEDLFEISKAIKGKNGGENE